MVVVVVVVVVFVVVVDVLVVNNDCNELFIVCTLLLSIDREALIADSATMANVREILMSLRLDIVDDSVLLRLDNPRESELLTAFRLDNPTESELLIALRATEREKLTAISPFILLLISVPMSVTNDELSAEIDMRKTFSIAIARFCSLVMALLMVVFRFILVSIMFDARRDSADFARSISLYIEVLTLIS